MVQIMQLDLSSLASVRQFAQAWQNRGLPLHVLICNAGIFSMSGGFRECEQEADWESAGPRWLGAWCGGTLDSKAACGQQ